MSMSSPRRLTGMRAVSSPWPTAIIVAAMPSIRRCARTAMSTPVATTSSRMATLAQPMLVSVSRAISVFST